MALASHGEEGEKEKTTPLQGQHPEQTINHYGSKHPEQTINVDQSMKGLLSKKSLWIKAGTASLTIIVDQKLTIDCDALLVHIAAT